MKVFAPLLAIAVVSVAANDNCGITKIDFAGGKLVQNRLHIPKDNSAPNAGTLRYKGKPFIPHVHLTPQGFVYLDDPYKENRPVFDSTFRPEITSMAINDWTNKVNEPEITYKNSMERHLHCANASPSNRHFLMKVLWNTLESPIGGRKITSTDNILRTPATRNDQNAVALRTS